MNDEERAKRIAKLEELIRQKQKVAKKLDQPQPTLKPIGERARREPYVEKTPEQIRQEAIAIDARQEAEERKAKEAAKEGLSSFERAEQTEVSKAFAENAQRERPTLEQREAMYRSMVEDQEDKTKNENTQERDSKFGSRFLRDDERER